MQLHNVTLQSSSAVKQAVVGCFVGGKSQEIILAKHDTISLLRVEAASDESVRVTQLAEIPVFGVVRSIASFRVTGGSKGNPTFTARISYFDMPFLF
jgi:splicing factor 3B subunit 3